MTPDQLGVVLHHHNHHHQILSQRPTYLRRSTQRCLEPLIHRPKLKIMTPLLSLCIAEEKVLTDPDRCSVYSRLRRHRHRRFNMHLPEDLLSFHIHHLLTTILAIH